MLEFFIALPIGTVIGWIIREVVSDKLARDRTIDAININEFNKAAGLFRGAFAPAIAKFPLLNDTNAINAMLNEELIPQAVAIERFRPFICHSKRDAYQEAWEEYHQSHKREGVSSVYFLDYVMGEEKERFAIFNKNINAVLGFTDKT